MKGITIALKGNVVTILSEAQDGTNNIDNYSDIQRIQRIQNEFMRYTYRYSA